jgi:sugar phosphate isomerase/epimerase
VFRIGATSYVIPDHILPNVRYLAARVDDVELVLFETDDRGSNLPDAATRRDLRDLAEAHDLTYTVHLPLDVLPGAAPEDTALVKAARVIDATRDIAPYAYTVHLDGRRFSDRRSKPRATEIASWRAGAVEALARIAGWIGDPRLLCIENVEAWDPALFAPILDMLPVSRTADLGHLWLQGRDAAGTLEPWLTRTRVVHLHGIAARDHASLAHVPRQDLDPVVHLLERSFGGVATLEVFNAEDLDSSLATLTEARERVRGERGENG